MDKKKLPRKQPEGGAALGAHRKSPETGRGKDHHWRKPLAWSGGVATAVLIGVLATVLSSQASRIIPQPPAAAGSSKNGGDISPKPTQASSPNPDLKVADVEIAPASKIDPASKDPNNQAYYNGTFGSAIDITMRNRGAAPALIVKATLTFTRITELYSCLGAGPGTATGVYDVKVPSSKVVTARDRPFALQRDMRFIVRANSIDRFRISVGPDAYGQSQPPWIYEFKLTLTEDNGHELDLGPMSTLGIPGNEWIDWFKSLTPELVASNRQQSCVAQIGDQLSRAIANPGLHSPELESLNGKARNLNAHAKP